MKKVLICITIGVIILILVVVNYSSYKAEYNMIMKENAEYEQYKDKELYGLDIATIINKTIDKNTRNGIDKDERGIFIPNETNSVEIEIYMLDKENTFKIEQFYNAGTTKFVNLYGNIKFKCSKIEYHKSTGKIKYILFEQTSIS